jgi:hypothetical protein
MYGEKFFSADTSGFSAYRPGIPAYKNFSLRIASN